MLANMLQSITTYFSEQPGMLSTHASSSAGFANRHNENRYKIEYPMQVKERINRTADFLDGKNM